MGSRILVAMIAVVTVAAVGGVGFAAFTSVVNEPLNGNTGTMNLELIVPAYYGNGPVTGNNITANYATEGLTGYLTCSVGNGATTWTTSSELSNPAYPAPALFGGPGHLKTVDLGISNAATGDTCTLSHLILYNFGTTPVNVHATVSMPGQMSYTDTAPSGTFVLHINQGIDIGPVTWGITSSAAPGTTYTGEISYTASIGV